MKGDVAQLTVRTLEGYEELTACSHLQLEVWGETYFDAVPPAILVVVQKIGGVVGGAFDASNKLVAFVFGLPGDRNGRHVHWSHMLAVLPEWRGLGVGAMLKAWQKDLVLTQGLTHMHWTYDPLESINAHLNLNRLGALPEEYVLDLYGDGSSSTLNNVIGTDRFVLVWHLEEADRLAYQARFAPLGNWHQAPLAVGQEGGVPFNPPAWPDAAMVRIEIPVSIQEVKAEAPEAARAWRTCTRKAFQHYFGAGYGVLGFKHDSSTGRSFYAMCRPL